MAIPFSGKTYIDALLARDDDNILGQPSSGDGGIDWTLTGTVGTATTVKYVWDETLIRSDLQGGVTSLETMTANQQFAMIQAFMRWSDVAKVTFQEVTNTAGLTPDSSAFQLALANGVIANTPTLNITGLTKSIETTGVSGDSVNKAAIYLDNIDLTNKGTITTAYNVGGKGYETAIHEVGHLLALEHPNGMEGDTPITDPRWLNNSLSIMSYNHWNGYNASGPMIYDIAAAQYLYGANTSYNSGNTIYGGPDNIGPYHVRFDGTQKAWTIWDAGGTEDVFDFSGSPSNRNLKLDLRGGVDDKGTATLTDDVVRFSEIGDERIAIAFDPSHYNTDGSLKPGKSGVVDIEIAKGGAGDDTIIGGYVANTLHGGAGNDKVYDPSSKTISGDYLYGDTPGSTLAGGNDTLWGGSNTFLYGGGGANDNATCTRIAA